jgi:hypothetical protein
MKRKIISLLTASILCLTPFTNVSAATPPLADGVDLMSLFYDIPIVEAPTADGIDTLAHMAPIEAIAEDGTPFSIKAYSSPGFTTGVYISGENGPMIFSLDSKGYAEYSSIYQAPVNPGETVQITYQTLNANTGSVLAGKNLSGVHSSGNVVLTTKVQANTPVKAYMYNYTGNNTAVSGNFNY